MRVVVATLTVLVVAGCSGSASPGPPPARSPSASQAPAATADAPTATSDWVTYHRTNDRVGAGVDLPRPTRLSPLWSTTLDGAVYGQALTVGALVIAATENNTVYALNRSDGSIRWSRHLAEPIRRAELPCGNIDPLGITGTPVYDPRSQRLFVVTETTGGRHDLVALDLAGTVHFSRTLDIAGRDPLAEQQRGALAVVGDRVYVPFGGLYGDCGNYVGYVTANQVDGSGATLTYAVPTRREGGSWAPSGVAADAAGDILVAVGNGESTQEPYDGSDSVLRLSADLSTRKDYFAPADWGSQNAVDADLGSTGPMLLDGGRILVSGKVGTVYLLDAAHLGGIGGEVAALDGCAGYGGMAWDVATQAAFVPCADGLQRVDVGATTLRRAWRTELAAGSPVVGGGAVWSITVGTGVLHAFDEANGAELVSIATAPTSRFASPTLSGRLVLVPTLSGVTAVRVD